MKTDQITLALEISRCGSISKAAQSLYIAQPNASNSIIALEQELGYDIFRRTYNGVEVTDKGERFLQYARSVEKSMEKMYLLRTEPKRVHLSVATYAYPFSENAFVRFCNENTSTADSLDCNLRRIGTVKEGIDLLASDLADISIFVCRRELYGQFEQEFSQKELVSEILGHTYLTIVLSEKHPLAQREHLDYNEYAKYPCISNAGLNENYVPVEIQKLLNDVNMHIVIEPGAARLNLLENSDYFAICTPYQKSELQKHHLVSRKLPNAERSLIFLMRETNRFDQQVMRYKELVKEELKSWEKNV